MAKDMIVLEGNVRDAEVPLRMAFLYRGLPEVKDELGTVKIPTPQVVVSDEIKAGLDPSELQELDAGTLAVEEVGLSKPGWVRDRTTLLEFVDYLQALYWVRRDRFLCEKQDEHCLRGLELDASEPGGGLSVEIVKEP